MATFMDVLQDVKDTQRIIEAGKTGGFMAMLDAQQKMRERQQLRDLAANSEASLALQRQALESNRRAEEARAQQARLDASREQARLQTLADLHAAERAREEQEKRRRDALPKCPECHSPLDGHQPRRCANCRSEVYWIQGEPYAQADVMRLAQSGWQLPDLQRCRQQLQWTAIELAAALCITRDHGISSVAACKDLFEKRLARVQALEKQVRSVSERLAHDDPLAQQKSRLAREMSDLQSRIDAAKARQVELELDFSSGAPDKRMRVQKDLQTLLAKSSPIVAQQNDVEQKVRLKLQQISAAAAVEKGKLRKQIESIQNGPPSLEELRAVCELAQQAEASIKGLADAVLLIEPLRQAIGGNAASMPSILETDFDSSAPSRLASPYGDDSIVEARLPSDVVSLSMSGQEAQQWVLDSATGVEVVRQEGTSDWVPVREAYAALFTPQAEKARLVRLIQKGIPALPAEAVEAAEDAVVDLLLPGMCAIAAADGVLQATERKMIVDLIREKGCSMEQDVLEEKVVDTCRRIHKNGLQSAVEQLCQTLSPFIGRPLCELFLDLLDRIAAADGRVGNRESAVLEFFKRRLAAT
jgi:hypothetical protein